MLDRRIGKLEDDPGEHSAFIPSASNTLPVPKSNKGQGSVHERVVDMEQASNTGNVALVDEGQNLGLGSKVIVHPAILHHDLCSFPSPLDNP